MYKVMIVEDEWFSRDSLINAVDWKSIDCEVVADAEDGKQALELIRQYAPDVIVSDIKMDIMDGLELCEEVRKIFPKIRVILLTGYSEFEYAQQAVKLGVKDFILKPTDPEELLYAVKRTLAEIENNRKRLEEYKRLQFVIDENIPALRERFILELANGRVLDEKEFRQRPDFLGLDFTGCYLAAMEIDNYEDFFKSHSERERQVIRLMVRDIGLDSIKSYGSGYFFEKENNLFLIYIKCSDVIKFAEILQRKVSDIAGIPVSMGISNQADSAERLNISFLQAVEALRHKFFIGSQCIICYNDLKRGESNGNIAMAGDEGGLLENLMLIVKAGNEEVVKVELDRIFELLASLKPDKTDYIKNVSLEIVILLQRLLLDMGEKPSAVFRDINVFMSITSCKVLKDIRSMLETPLLEAAGLVHERDKKMSRSAVDKILEHLNRNFNREISLEDLGSIAYLNSKYLCSLIKKKTGSNFSDILLGLRIEKAKEMLAQKDLRTYEIAEMVGIGDSRYFSKVFKKQVGMTPTEFRQQFIQNA